MKKMSRSIAMGLIIVLFLLALAACAAEDNDYGKTADDAPADDIAAGEQAGSEDEEGDFAMKMMINDTPVTVKWENNKSVKALAKMTEDGPVTIETEPYGGFEQVGSIGQTLPSNDTNIKTKAGDIMLYTSSQMVIFYGSNSWAYTRLGRITDKSNSELRDLLSGYGCKVTITAE